jgi:mediator of replication checkpoint protein 1
MIKRRWDHAEKAHHTGAHPETRPFFDAYQRDLVDDNDEFVNLQSEDIVMGSADEDEEEPRETVSYDDIRRQLREAAQQDAVSGFYLCADLYC